MAIKDFEEKFKKIKELDDKAFAMLNNDVYEEHVSPVFSLMFELAREKAGMSDKLYNSFSTPNPKYSDQSLPSGWNLEGYSGFLPDRVDDLIFEGNLKEARRLVKVLKSILKESK